ncbi:hypothetical protein POTOM_012511 [Populus tomentosa]|uniref:Uncharacterized protein n=1 Tax=Populus tomentosa TaxID=118781 RepID=A0A8X8AEV1_POPTO|nr:hypothetical protein POTOM_012511 [Populus tomentosa]
MTSTPRQTQQHEVPLQPLSAPNATGAEFLEPSPSSTVTEETSHKIFEPVVIHKFHEWGKKAETTARNIWHHLKAGPSVPEAAWGNLTGTALTEGGFESLFILIFETDPSAKLEKTSACYLSTSTGPVAGSLYLSICSSGFLQ